MKYCRLYPLENLLSLVIVESKGPQARSYGKRSKKKPQVVQKMFCGYQNIPFFLIYRQRNGGLVYFKRRSYGQEGGASSWKPPIK
jgi:hypothetical protein